MQIDRERLLKAAARFDSQSSGSEAASDSDSGSRGARRQPEHSKHSKKRKSKHSSKKSHKTHKRHKRSDHEKIAELEKRAAAMGAGSMLPSMGRMGFGKYSSTATAASGDAVTLDTSGDANNALYESLYGGDLPRYNRMDPLDLVRVSRRLGGQLQRDADIGNTTADRYYRGRHYLQERNRSTKRINLSNLQLHQHSHTGSMGLKAHSSSNTMLLPPITPLLPPGGKSSAAAATTSGGFGASQQQQQGGSSGRRLAIPAPAFIPLEAPQELLQQQEGGASGDAGSWRQQQQQGHQGKLRAIEPTELIEQAGLSADELLLQATRAWNMAVRERPHDEVLWLEFAAFQHSAAQQQQQRGRAATTGLLDPVTAEKQISLLSRGLVHHPSSTQLLLALLRCYAAVAPDADALEAKWAAVLARQGGSWELWREYIALRQCSFADFKVSGLLKVSQDALHSLQLELLSQRRRAAAALKEQRKQPPQLTQEQQQQLTPLGAAAAAAATASSSGLGLGLPVTLSEEALELQLVQLLLGLLYVEFEAGYTEQALAKMQALLEFHLFPPQLPPGGVPALLRLFAAYWSAGVPRIGEAGARGWAYWCLWHAMGMEQPSAAPAAAPAAAEEQAAEAATVAAGPQQPDPAGWSGWFEVPQAASPPKPSGDSLAAAAAEGGQGSGDADATADAASMSHQRAQQESVAEGDGDSEGSESGSEEGQAAAEDDDTAEELDEEELMQQLGLQLEQQLQEVERQGLPADVLARWVEEEAASCASQWQPLRPDWPKTPATSSPEPQPDAASPPDPARVASLDSIQPCLFLLRSDAALRRLVLGCVEMLGVPMGPVPWCSSNCPTPWQQQALHAPMGAAVNGLGSSGSDSSSKGSCWSNAAEQGAGVAGGMQQQQQQQQQQCQQVPWYAASDERWQWAVNVLQRLAAGGPCGDWPELCQALMLMLASKPSDAAAATTTAAGDSGSVQGSHAGQHAAGGGLQLLTFDGAATAIAAAAAGLGVRLSQQQLSAARAAAKQLLSDQQENLLLYDAYGCLEAAAGQVKTARKVFETALALATTAAAAAAAAGTAAGPAAGTSAQDTTPAAASEAAARLAVHLAQLELTTGGAGGWVKAHVALHALLTRQQLQVSAAAEAAGIISSQGQLQPQQQQQQTGGGLLAEAQLRAARVKFDQQIPGLISSAGGFLTPAAASTLAAAALFELVVGLRRSEAATGLDAAVAVCKQVSAAVPEAVRAASAQHEQLAILQCHMLVAAATGSVRSLAPGLGLHDSSKGGNASASRSNASTNVDAALAASLVAVVPPARAREALAAALQLYPHSKALLQLQVALDHACLTLSGLRRQLAALLEMNPSPGLWAVALQAEALRPGGRVRLGVLFERALSAPTALQWHQQERLQRQRNTRAWDAACADLAPPPRRPEQQEGQGQAQQQRQQLLQQPVTAQGRAAVLQDLAVWDGYRGWGHCEAGLWQQYIQHELGLGRLDAARKLFLRAVHAMPGAKGLWLSGFGAVCAGMQPRECSGLLNVMQEREVMVRTDVYEVLLAAMAEKQQNC